MEKKWDKKILLVLMQWDYGIKARGPSCDKSWFYNNFCKLASNIEPFWYDDYINNLPLLQKKLIARAKDFNPDLIFFIPYTNQFEFNTLDYLKTNWSTCAWFGDDTWRFKSYSSKLAPHFTHICTTDVFRVQDYKKIGINPILTQWAAQSYTDRVLDFKKIDYKYDVSFVGAKNRVRQWFVTKLETLGIKVSCFGLGWPSGKVTFEEMEEIFLKTKINLNLSNSVSLDVRYVFGGIKNLITYFISPKKSEQIKARNFEIPLFGGFQLTNYVAGIEQYLKIGEEVAVFSSPEECAQQIKYYLSNEIERKKNLLEGYQRVKKEHTYYERLNRVLKKIWE